MSKQYGLTFGADPRTNIGLSPTMILFVDMASGSGLTAPVISAIGQSTGIYGFTYAPTAAVYFECDGGSGLSDADRYNKGILDPIQVVDQRIGTTSDSFGSTASDPSTLFGYAKRNQEFEEGNASFSKSTGKWDVYSRGSSTLLVEKSLTNSTSTASKT